MTTPYGEYAERAATAIAALIRGGTLPATPHALQVALGSRDIVVATLRERTREQFGIRVRNDDPRAGMPVASSRMRSEPVTELAYVIERLPRLRPEDRRSPLDVLGRIDDPVATAWVETARNLMVADHILATAEARPWRTDPVAHAALTADTAQLVEAIAVLDHRLAAAGAPDGHVLADTEASAGTVDVAAVTAESVANARLVAGAVDRFRLLVRSPRPRRPGAHRPTTATRVRLPGQPRPRPRRHHGGAASAAGLPVADGEPQPRPALPAGGRHRQHRGPQPDRAPQQPA